MTDVDLLRQAADLMAAGDPCDLLGVGEPTAARAVARAYLAGGS